MWDDAAGPTDLSPLDPLADPEQGARLRRRLNQAAAAELARRRVRSGIWGCVASWRRPVLAAAGAVAVAASLALIVISRPVDSGTTLAEAAGVPRAWAQLTRDAQAPAPEILLQLDVGRP